MTCENLKKCPFYNEKMPIDSAIGKMYKRTYCEGDKTKCARYNIGKVLGKQYVPSDLYPNMTDRANKIIDENK
ncbi:hypothetical protein ACFIJ5_08260 [Haloimpatiens sp. FM7330]|uniref:hypothetical protein n=1 Tax=Haloimpatiens sp. FM7330 TaxID=3298610 RepID=UPI00363D03B2